MEKGNKIRMAVIIIFCVIVLVAILLGVYYITRQLDTLETVDTRVYNNTSVQQNKVTNDTDNTVNNELTNQVNQTDEGEE